MRNDRVSALRRVCGGIALILFLVAGIVLVRTLTYSLPARIPVESTTTALDAEASAQRLAGALRFPTISHQDASPDSQAFLGLHRYLEASYPLLHATLLREQVGGLSLVYRWSGTDPTAPPVLLMAHQDVVPAEQPTEWRHDPFGGTLEGGYIWGRGALDNKSGLTAILEAVELMLREGRRPSRTVYLAFGHDEEKGGSEGAAEIARILRGRSISFEMVLDEGGFITRDTTLGIHAPVALVGVAEKGYLSLELTALGSPGHSSAPPARTSVGVLSSAIARIEAHPFPPHLEGPSLRLFQRIGPTLPFLQRMALANLWLFEPLVVRQLTRVPATNAAIRTTAAATMFTGSIKENSLPARATAIVNFRLLPGWTIRRVVTAVREIVDDPSISIRVLPAGSEPSPVSDMAGPAFRYLERSIFRVSPEKDLVVSPYLVIGATDSRYFNTLARNIYRFNGARVSADDLRAFHGPDERIAISEYLRAIRFYHAFLAHLDEL